MCRAENGVSAACCTSGAGRRRAWEGAAAMTSAGATAECASACAQMIRNGPLGVMFSVGGSAGPAQGKERTTTYHAGSPTSSVFSGSCPNHLPVYLRAHRIGDVQPESPPSAETPLGFAITNNA